MRTCVLLAAADAFASRAESGTYNKAKRNNQQLQVSIFKLVIRPGIGDTIFCDNNIKRIRGNPPNTISNKATTFRIGGVSCSGRTPLPPLNICAHGRMTRGSTDQAADVNHDLLARSMGWLNMVELGEVRIMDIGIIDEGKLYLNLETICWRYLEMCTRHVRG